MIRIFGRLLKGSVAMLTPVDGYVTWPRIKGRQNFRVPTRVGEIRPS